ncbi:MAG: hypothetical protein JNL98_09465 [Bryobacterales bacterium]|nr:hypothetical protein [Bryobacterales bacterium]
MKRFRFQLEMALEWRRQRMMTQQARLEQLLSQVQQLRRLRQQLQQDYDDSEASTRSNKTIEAADLQALSAFRRAVEFRQGQLVQQERKLADAIVSQRKVLMEETRQTKLLEKLKERKHADWKKEADRELENDASDAFLAKWGMRAGDD